MGYREQLQMLMDDPKGMAHQNGYSIPENISDPKDMVMHLIKTGQVPNPLLQRVMPLVNFMNGK